MSSGDSHLAIHTCFPLIGMILISMVILFCPEAVVQRYSVKKVFLEILQNSQKNTCARVSF